MVVLPVFVKLLSGNTFVIYCRGQGNIQKMKHTMGRGANISPDEQCTIFSGKRLDDGGAMDDYNIAQYSLVRMTGRLPGGSLSEAHQAGVQQHGSATAANTACPAS